MLVGVRFTVRLLVLFVVRYVVSPGNIAWMVYIPAFCVMVYCSVAIPLVLVVAVPIVVPFKVKLMVFPDKRFPLLSFKIAVKFIKSPLEPVTGFIVIAVGIIFTVRLLVLLVVRYVVSPVNIAWMVYVPVFCVMVYCSVAVPLVLVVAVPIVVPFSV